MVASTNAFDSCLQFIIAFWFHQAYLGIDCMQLSNSCNLCQTEQYLKVIMRNFPAEWIFANSPIPLLTIWTKIENSTAFFIETTIRYRSAQQAGAVPLVHCNWFEDFLVAACRCWLPLLRWAKPKGQLISALVSFVLQNLPRCDQVPPDGPFGVIRALLLLR